jgi:hypothetical protein
VEEIGRVGRKGVGGEEDEREGRKEKAGGEKKLKFSTMVKGDK